MDVLLVDGYNMIGAWEELKVLKDTDLEQARQLLIEKLAEYQAYRSRKVIVVFDAYEVRGLESREEKYKVEVIYTKENETADQCIERLVKEWKDVRTKVFVATSDYTEQRTIFAQGAFRMSARELDIEIKNIQREIELDIREHQETKIRSKIPLDQEMLKIFEKWRRGNK
ncbi:NYN domain-containing protein [Gracilibacillus alcaliphilus]|uniref:NYN domain-containing protein n=1 Tax=Gracilibacillus alcaliphilus TaxID=1401441 RepID=UPI00195880FB|nr:NYN domain-containing protein [Gracilibacillus alcaliphilus]MBM7677321.1 putative RNA-binding protein with PIN domain [Gracilibacillus alcaliphilus]